MGIIGHIGRYFMLLLKDTLSRPERVRVYWSTYRWRRWTCWVVKSLGIVALLVGSSWGR
jgi:hypothetical protein